MKDRVFDKAAMNIIKDYHTERKPLSIIDHAVLFYFNNKEIKEKTSYGCYQYVNRYMMMVKHKIIVKSLDKLGSTGLITADGFMTARFKITERGKRHLAEIFNWKEVL